MTSYLLVAERHEGIVNAGHPGTPVGVSSTHPLATFEKQEVAERMQDRLSDTTRLDLVVVEVDRELSLADLKSRLDEVSEEGDLSQISD